LLSSLPTGYSILKILLIIILSSAEYDESANETLIPNCQSSSSALASSNLVIPSLSCILFPASTDILLTE
jgi:hypothetical protein